MIGRLWFGPIFPDAAHRGSCWFGPIFPDCAPDPGVVAGVGPPGVATLMLDIDAGFTVKMSYSTDIIKSWDATERQRIAAWDLPRVSFSGTAWLIDSGPREIRAKLARYASTGQPYRLALPHEEATILEDSPGSIVATRDTDTMDWAVLGQRCVVSNAARTQFETVVIQDVGSTSLVIDKTLGDLGRRGSVIMPSVAVLINPTQGFARYPNPEGIEQWKIEATQLGFGYRQLGRPSSVAFTDTSTGVLANAVAQFDVNGAVGNTASISILANFFAPFIGQNVGTTSNVQIQFHPGNTTVQNVLDLLADTNIKLIGSLPALSTVLTIPDNVSHSDLVGGLDDIWGYMGRGASVTTWGGRPIWDQGIQLEGGETAQDSLQSMVELIDLGGILQQLGPASTPDWGRQVSLHGDYYTDFQWCKAFVSTVIGPQKSFWLPTQRADLVPVSFDITNNSLTVETSAESGDIYAWLGIRNCIQIRLTDQSVLWYQIIALVDNLDGTATLTLEPNPGGPPVIIGGPPPAPTLVDVDMISWLEPCRFESDDFAFEFKGGQVELKEQARVVRQ